MQPTSVTITNIDTDFIRATLGGFTMIVDTQDSYVNVTHICAQGLTKKGMPKDFDKWKCKNRELIQSAALHLATPLDKLITRHYQSTDAEKAGVYIHPELVPYIAMRVCPQFAVKAAAIMQQLKFAELHKKIAKHQSDLSALVAESHTIEDELRAELQQLRTKYDAIVAQIKVVENAANKTSDNAPSPYPIIRVYGPKLAPPSPGYYHDVLQTVYIRTGDEDAEDSCRHGDDVLVGTIDSSIATTVRNRLHTVSELLVAQSQIYVGPPITLAINRNSCWYSRTHIMNLLRELGK